MRYIISALLISFCFLNSAAAYELEDHRIYKVSDSTGVIRIISTADISAFEPLIRIFQVQNPTISIDYSVASSAELMKAISNSEGSFDLAISSAMDLQTKLANDGFAQAYISDNSEGMPAWSKWRNHLFAFTQEPAALVVSKEFFKELSLPNNRDELIDLLRNNSELFSGKIGTYDVRDSGLGYLFATQDSRNTDSFWRLTEVMGRLNTKLYCCSGAMIDDVASGELALAYNVLGSYAEIRLKSEAGITIVPLQDFTTVMMRTALIPINAQNSSEAGKMIDFLLSQSVQDDLLKNTGLPPISQSSEADANALRSIKLGPGLLVFLDRLKRKAFLQNWENSILQE